MDAEAIFFVHITGYSYDNKMLRLKLEKARKNGVCPQGGFPGAGQGVKDSQLQWVISDCERAARQDGIRGGIPATQGFLVRQEKSAPSIGYVR
jgi:hypothetical protein